MNNPYTSYEESHIPAFVSDALLEFKSKKFSGLGCVNNDVNVIDRLVKTGNKDAYLYAGQMAIDLATRDIMPTQTKSEWFKYANYLLEQVGEIDDNNVRGSGKALTAIINKYSIPLYRSLYLDKRIPRNETISNFNSKLMPTLYKSIKILNSDCYDKYDHKELSLYIGIASELSILMLLNRYFSNNLPDRSMVAVPALISEDFNNNRNTLVSSSFDISVYCQFDKCLPERAYKIQVKNTISSIESKIYDDDIKLINVPSKLALYSKKLKKHKKTSVNEIIYELISERRINTSTKPAAENLNKRAEILLDYFDE